MAIPFSLTFRGKQLLLEQPHAVDSRPLVRTLRNEVAEVVHGPRIVETNPEPPSGVHQLDFVCETRQDTRNLEDFFDARRGAWDGFWVPTWQWEFEIVNYDEGVIGGHDYFWVRSCDYAASIFPLGEAHRWLAFLYGAQYSLRHCIAAAANTPSASGYERLDLADVGTSGAFPSKPYTEQKGVRPLWLKYVRLADSELSVQELGLDSSLVTIHVVERPQETP